MPAWSREVKGAVGKQACEDIALLLSRNLGERKDAFSLDPHAT